jgi:hypothetical protein
MRRLWIAAAVVGLLFGAVLAAALVFVRPDDLRPLLETSLEDALGRDVSLGKLELSLLPLPAVRVDGVRIAGTSEKAPPFAEVESVRIRLALLPLLVGRIGLASLDLERPRLSVPLDRRGRPILPGATAPGREAAPSGAEPAPGEEAAKPAAGGVLLAIDRVRLRNASAEVGPHRISALEAEGSLSPGGAVSAEFAFELPGGGKVRDGRARVDDVFAGEPVVELDARLAEGDLAGLARLANLGPGYAGRVELELEGVRLRGSQPEAGRVRARLRELDAKQGDLALAGEARAQAELGGDYLLDLTGAELASAGVTRKPRGMELAVRGKTPGFPLAGAEGVLALAGSEIKFSAQLQRGNAWVVSVAPFALELEPLAPVLGVPVRGRLVGDGMQVSYPPPLVIGDTHLQGGRYPLGTSEAAIDGDVTFTGLRVIGKPLRIGVAGQTIDTEVTLSVQGLVATVVAKASGLDLEALAGALAGSKDVGGSLVFDGHVELPLGADDPLRLATGIGRFEIAPGRIRGFSLARQTFGELAALPVLLQALRGRDLSRYEEEEFQSLSADYSLRDGFAYTDNLRLVYRNAEALFHGKIGLADGALDLAGKVEISRELDGELGGRGDKPRVIPISSIKGTVTEPRLRLDSKAVSAAASAYLGSGRVAEKIDEKLGPGAAEAVEGILDVLRGARRAPAPAEPKPTEPPASESTPNERNP